ncbi:MAG: sensor histidine kinase, partial [Candidatus Methylomirabilales bacterium]
AIQRGAQGYEVKGSITADSLRFSIHNAIEKASLQKLSEERGLKLEEQNRNLRERERQVRTIIQNSADGLVVVDAEGLTSFLNPAAEGLFCRKAQEMTGSRFPLPIEIERTIEARIDRDDGARTVELWTTRIEWEDRPALLVTLRDISRRKQVEEMKSNLIANVSHELRNPLTSIKNAIDTVAGGQAGPLTPHQFRFLSMASRNIDRLSSMINDILDLSKIEAGQMEYRFAPVDLGALLEQVVATFLPQAEAKGVSLACGSGPPGGPPVRADPERLEQVLCNLVSNAIKFTPSGGRVALSAAPAGGEVEVSVTDSGIGISPEDQRRIFDRFYQVGGDPLQRSSKGTGLGLAISRSILEAHGAALRVESDLGKGSRF